MAGASKVFCGIVAALLILVGVGVHPASAGGSPCLAVVNTTNQSFSFTVDGWNQYNWTWRPNEELTYVSFNGIDIKSPNADGSFMVRGALGTTVTKSNTKFDFHPEMTGGRGQVGTCDGTWVMTIGYGPGPAPVPGGGGMNYDYPGSCLYVKNTKDFSITLKLAHPTGYENVHWDFPAGDEALVARSGSPLKTPDGGWSVTTTNGNQGTWSYDPSYTQEGCNGQWVFTM